MTSAAAPLLVTPLQVRRVDALPLPSARQTGAPDSCEHRPPHAGPVHPRSRGALWGRADVWRPARRAAPPRRRAAAPRPAAGARRHGGQPGGRVHGWTGGPGGWSPGPSHPPPHTPNPCPRLQHRRYPPPPHPRLTPPPPRPPSPQLIADEDYWRRRAAARWRNCDPAGNGRSWKQLFFERHLQEALEGCAGGERGLGGRCYEGVGAARGSWQQAPEERCMQGLMDGRARACRCSAGFAPTRPRGLSGVGVALAAGWRPAAGSEPPAAVRQAHQSGRSRFNRHHPPCVAALRRPCACRYDPSSSSSSEDSAAAPCAPSTSGTSSDALPPPSLLALRRLLAFSRRFARNVRVGHLPSRLDPQVLLDCMGT